MTHSGKKFPAAALNILCGVLVFLLALPFYGVLHLTQPAPLSRALGAALTLAGAAAWGFVLTAGLPRRPRMA